jgi:methionyl-tRNA synthetase
MAKKKFYITTAIDYVNAKPHIGHAMEKVIADAIARWHRLLGEDVFYLTGTDENAQKNVQAAKVAGVSVREFVDKNTGYFLDLVKNLNISHNKFVRTSAEEHARVVTKIIKKMNEAGDIYKGKYEGHYCTGCESYITEKDLVNGKCPEHCKAPEFMSEDAYFFKLSKYQGKLIKFAEKYIVPVSKKKEILYRLNEGLNDLCISRKGADWGIDFPLDKEYKVYVWVDALINYVSGAENKWPADVHVIGKGINWFHSVIWPGILMSAGYKLPDKLLVHGYLNLGGKKISKSLGNTIDPLDLLEIYNPDSLRYSLLKCNVFDDSDYNEEIIIERHNTELANKLGNLISRVSSLAEKNGIEKCENRLLKKLKLKDIEKKMSGFELDKALGEIFGFIDICNEYVQSKKPWETHDKKVLYELIDSIKSIAILLWPFIPETSEKIAKSLGFKIDYNEITKPYKVQKIKKSEILFKKIEVSEKKQDQKKESKQDKKKEGKKQNKVEGVIDMKTIQYDDFAKLEIKVGTIKKAEDIEGADKLYKLTVDCGEKKQRTICAGIKKDYTKDELKGKQIVVIVNLAPRKLKGTESQGMLLCSVDKNDKCVLIGPEKKVDVGNRVS